MMRPTPLLVAAALFAALLLAPLPGAAPSAGAVAVSARSIGARPASTSTHASASAGAGFVLEPAGAGVRLASAPALRSRAARATSGGAAAASPGPGPVAPGVHPGTGSAAGPGLVALELESHDGTYTVTCRIVPEDFEVGDLFGLELEVRRADGEPVTATLAVDARMPEHGHGMNREPIVEARGGGRFEASNLMFHMPGYWELYLDLTRGAVTERAQAPLELE